METGSYASEVYELWRQFGTHMTIRMIRLFDAKMSAEYKSWLKNPRKYHSVFNPTKVKD